MKIAPGMFGVGTLVWILLTSLAVSLLFNQRIRRVLNAQRKPLDLPSVRTLFSHSDYSRSDVYGAFLGWIGCAVTLVALALIGFQPELCTQ